MRRDPLASRQPAPGEDVRPLVLPDDTLLKAGYRLQFLAAGGMSVAYRATRDSRTYIVKEAAASEPRNVMALTQEKSTLERLDHPAIGRAVDLFEEDGYFYLVLDYVDGDDLESLVPPEPEGFLSETQVLDWAFQLCDVLEYLHRQTPPVIYRDLKPRNIILDRDGRIHLVDFGIARVFKNARQCDTLPMGSALFASPEHYGSAQTDQRSDIFTLGATIHYLLTGGRDAGQDAFTYTPIREINPQVSTALEQVVSTAVAIEPGRRFATVSEMRRALTACATGEIGPETTRGNGTSVQPPVSAPPPASTELKTRASAAWALVGLFLGLYPLLWMWSSGRLSGPQVVPSAPATVVVMVPSPVSASPAPEPSAVPASPEPSAIALPPPSSPVATTASPSPPPVSRATPSPRARPRVHGPDTVPSRPSVVVDRSPTPTPAAAQSTFPSPRPSASAAEWHPPHGPPFEGPPPPGGGRPDGRPFPPGMEPPRRLPGDPPQGPSGPPQGPYR